MYSVDILEPLSSIDMLIDSIKYHHERYDGKGYPTGKKGKEIPLEARILSVADAFDAMLSDRPYRKGMKINEVLAELKTIPVHSLILKQWKPFSALLIILTVTVIVLVIALMKQFKKG